MSPGNARENGVTVRDFPPVAYSSAARAEQIKDVPETLLLRRATRWACSLDRTLPKSPITQSSSGTAEMSARIMKFRFDGSSMTISVYNMAEILSMGFVDAHNERCPDFIMVKPLN
jgi:hypothetical protein